MIDESVVHPVSVCIGGYLLKVATGPLVMVGHDPDQNGGSLA
jgi:hypothetical protein